MKIDKGDIVLIDFHCFGVVTTEEEKVLSVSGNILTINSEDESSKFEFDLKTGKCLNDNTFGGAKRKLNSKFIQE